MKIEKKNISKKKNKIILRRKAVKLDTDNLFIWFTF